MEVKDTMNVVVFVGNGFDIALGLKTGYPQFLRWWCEQNENHIDENLKCSLYDLKQTLLRRQLRGERFWSDLEMSLGEIDYSQFKSVKGNIKELPLAIIPSLTLLGSNLAVYLEQIQEQFCIPDDMRRDAKSIFLSSLINSIAPPFIGEFLPKRIALKFVTLNYTDSIEKIVSVGEENAVMVSGQSISVCVEAIMHVHGSLKGNLCIGLDNMKQFTGTKLNNVQYEQCKQICKRFTVNSNLIREAESAIGMADLVVTFGVSWGSTDQSWWQFLAKYLMGEHRRIYDCPYSSNIDLFPRYQLTDGLRNRVASRILRAMFGCSQLCDCMLAHQLAERVFCAPLEERNFSGISILPGDYFGLSAISRMLSSQTIQ